MKIWIIDHYSVPPKYYPLARNTNFAKNLMKMGHDVLIFAASTVHNSTKNLIEGKEKYKETYEDGVKYVLIKCHQYTGNGLKRMMNMYEFAFKLISVCNHYPKPDAIVSTSMTLQACKKGILLGKKYGCKTVAQIGDLWPESIVTYGLAGRNSLPVVAMRRTEKWIYMNCDSIVFTMEGAYEYIRNQKWDKDIPENKVFFINNGVELDKFDDNAKNNIVIDDDLEDKNTYKIIYTGSLRRANSQIFFLLDVAEKLKDNKHEDIRILIYGKGDLSQEIEEICRNRGLTNVLLKGFVNKEKIPYILSKCDLNILNCISADILKYGGSQNKLFEYLASGHPIISGEDSPYSVVSNRHCGISRTFNKPEDLVTAIDELRSNPPSYDYIRSVAEEYDFKRLTKALLDVIVH